MKNKQARQITKGLKGTYRQPSDTLVSMYGCKWTTPRRGSFQK